MARSHLGTMLRLLLVPILIFAPAYWAVRQEAQSRNLRVVQEGVLYRSGQMSLPALKRLIHDYGIRTVVCLRELNRQNSQDEANYCLKEELNYLVIEPMHWQLDAEGHAPVDEGIAKFLEVMRDPSKQPVLIHCFAGIHRTGGYCAAFRMEFNHWDNSRALAEMKACGYSRLDEEPDILGYLERYQPSWRTAENALSSTQIQPISTPKRPRKSS